MFDEYHFSCDAADIYCYICNDAKLDPDLSAHLATFGINVDKLTKTEKSMTELVSLFSSRSTALLSVFTNQQIEHNLKYDFSLTSDDGQALEPLFGPGLTGLANLGNRCVIYVAVCKF